VEPKAARALLSAVGFSGTPEAQSALAHVMTDARTDVETRLAAVDSVMTVERPTAEMRNALTAIVDSGEGPLKTNASYMLGVAANRLQVEEPAASQEIVERMTTDFAASDDTSDQVRIVDSLGNAGTSDALTSIELGLDSPDPEVRDASARALRFVEDPRADQLLSRTMTEDASPAVRRGALFATGFRSFGPLAAALETVCKTDRDGGVRQSAVDALASLAKGSGEPLLLLDWVAQHDPDQALRQQAQKALERPQG
jgi:HEAT repeat protein